MKLNAIGNFNYQSKQQNFKAKLLTDKSMNLNEFKEPVRNAIHFIQQGIQEIPNDDTYTICITNPERERKENIHYQGPGHFKVESVDYEIGSNVQVIHIGKDKIEKYETMIPYQRERETSNWDNKTPRSFLGFHTPKEIMEDALKFIKRIENGISNSTFVENTDKV